MIDENGEPVFTREGTEVIEALRTCEEGDELTVHTDEGAIEGEIMIKSQQETDLVAFVEPSDSALEDDLILAIKGNGRDRAGWSVTAGLFRDDPYLDTAPTRVRRVETTDD